MSLLRPALPEIGHGSTDNVLQLERVSAARSRRQLGQRLIRPEQLFPLSFKVLFPLWFFRGHRFLSSSDLHRSAG